MSINLKKTQKLPDTPGVYFFLGKNKKILYIGKATSIRSRVKSYFVKDIITIRSPLIAQLMEEAISIDYTKTDSVLEALILEADLIKKFKPEFNTKEKDDKSFLCVVITKEDFPVIKLVRKKDVIGPYYGAYPEAQSIKEGLKIIRKIFPYRDEKCLPRGASAKWGKPCFNYQIGLCPGTCVGAISKKEYTITIRNIRLFLQGKKSKLIMLLKKEMREAVNHERFEVAGKKRNQIFALQHIQDVSLIKQKTDNYNQNNTNNDGGSNAEFIFRIESYDIAHMSGKNMVGVMTVMENGELMKNEYKKFIIRKFDSSNDTGALQEVLTRRFNHPEWNKPDIVIVDGGQAQLNAVSKIISNLDVHMQNKIALVSVVKDDKHKAREIMGDAVIADKYKKEIIQLNAEAHRYAIAFHKKRRNKNFLI
jgi:excinuclease ABC subunit C